MIHGLEVLEVNGLAETRIAQRDEVATADVEQRQTSHDHKQADEAAVVSPADGAEVGGQLLAEAVVRSAVGDRSNGTAVTTREAVP